MCTRLIAAMAFFVACSPVSAMENNLTVYYNMDWKPVGLLIDGNALKENVMRYGLIPCTCQDYTCGCCINMNINFANFSRTGCLNSTYLPDDFALEMNMLWDNESIYKRNVSAKNPPPACIDVPITYLPTVQFCVKLYDIHTMGQNIHTCIDFETKIERAPVLVLQFDCIEMGTDGFSHVKPTGIMKSEVTNETGKMI